MSGFARDVPGKPHIGRRKCPWCGLIVVWDDQRRRVSHQAPVCAGFDALMTRAQRELGPGSAVPMGPEVLPYGDDDDDAKPS